MIWQDFLSSADRDRLERAGQAGSVVIGNCPALIVIDVCWSFTGDDPHADILDSIQRWPNSCGAESWQAVERISELLEAARGNDLTVAYSRGLARADGWDSGSWAWKNARTSEWLACDAASAKGGDIVTDIAPADEEAVYHKRKPSAFFGTSLATDLRRRGCDSVCLVGTTTSGCVRATAVDAFSYGFNVTAIADGCFDRGQASHAVALFDIAIRYGSVVNTTEALAKIHCPKRAIGTRSFKPE
jgi:nicotinamidase-related amidase